jgi:hypothetical protein
MPEIAEKEAGLRFRLWQSQIVPRGTIWGEWEGSGNLCCKWLFLLSLPLRNIMAICALLQRMGIFGGEREKISGFLRARFWRHSWRESGFVIWIRDMSGGTFPFGCTAIFGRFADLQSQATATADSLREGQTARQKQQQEQRQRQQQKRILRFAQDDNGLNWKRG